MTAPNTVRGGHLIRPLADRRKPRPIAVIAGASPGHLRVLTEHGDDWSAGTRSRAGDLLRSLEGWQVYSLPSLRQTILAPGATCWTGSVWKGALTRIKLDGGPVVHRLPRAVGSVAPPDALAAVVTVCDWLAGFGVVPGSTGGMAWRLWRSTLTRELRFDGPGQRGALYGGRQECPAPMEYREVVYWDLSAAYPTAMAAAPYPLRLRRVSTATELRADEAGMAAATVTVPEAAWCPLPMRLAPRVVCYGWGEWSGWWTWAELAAARDVGARIDVHECLAPMGAVDLFGPWWKLVAEGRQLPGAAGALVKAMTSVLWGHFAIHGVASTVRWSDHFGRQRVTVKMGDDDRALPHARMVHVAAETASRVRGRLWRDAIQGCRTPIYVDTDAVMVGRHESPPESAGWRSKADMLRVDIRAPQAYRWLCEECPSAIGSADPDHPDWHYVVAGMGDRAGAEHIFRRRVGGRQIAAALHPGADLTLPAMPVEEAVSQFTARRVPGVPGPI